MAIASFKPGPVEWTMLQPSSRQQAIWVAVAAALIGVTVGPGVVRADDPAKPGNAPRAGGGRSSSRRGSGRSWSSSA